MERPLTYDELEVFSRAGNRGGSNTHSSLGYNTGRSGWRTQVPSNRYLRSSYFTPLKINGSEVFSKFLFGVIVVI